MDNSTTTDDSYYDYLWSLNVPWFEVAAWFCPIISVLAIVVNAIVMWVLPKVQGISRTARIYYMCLAFHDLTSAIVMGIFNYFLSQGLPYSSHLTIRSDLLLQTDFAGGMIYFVQDGLLATLNWTYVIFTSERLAMILSPIRMRTLIKTKYVYASLAIIAILSWAISLSHVWSTTSSYFFGILVSSYGIDGFAAIVAAYVIPAENFCFVPILNLVLLVMIVCKLRAEAHARAKLQQKAAASKGGDSATITLICMALTHCLLFATYGVATFAMVALAGASAAVQARLYTWQCLQNEFLGIDNCVGFFFYLALMKPFSDALRKQFGCNGG